MENKKNIILFDLEDLLGDRFGQYSKYIIQERAIPDVRDGLKPVQRRIIYAMLVNGNIPTKGYRKSATAVGFVIGHYHPHGDTSVYDAMVRMSQWWKQSIPLIDMHGNNGSLDDDPPAAMRYTEARLSEISMDMLKDIEKNTVNFAPNYDDTDEEPTVLPCHFPNILVNGSEGIAAGYSTYIPPHNFNEVCEALIYRIKKPKCSIEDIINIIPGPDFPTGGIIRGKEGLKDALTKGAGSFQVVSKYEIIESKSVNNIVISEIPFGVNKGAMCREIEKIKIDKEIEGIVDVRDETDRKGLRVVIDCKKEANIDSIINYLFKKTKLVCKYSYNTVCICDKKPYKLGILDILDFYIKHNIEVINRRIYFDLNKLKSRLHIVDGLIVAIDKLDDLIAIIRSSTSKAEMKLKIEDRFNLTETQAEAIVTLQLYRLNSVDVHDLIEEKKELEDKISDLESKYQNESKIKKIIVEETNALIKKYKTPRLSKIEDEILEFTVENKPIIKEDVYISITKDAYYKRSSTKSYLTSDGVFPNIKDGDMILSLGLCNTENQIISFTNMGNFIYIPVHELSDLKWKDEGKHINNIVSITGDEKILNSYYVKDYKQGIYIVLVTKNGLIKKTPIQEFILQRYSKPSSCIKLQGDDRLVGAYYSDGDSQIIVITKNGKAVQYHESKVSILGIRAAGIRAINLDENDEVASLIVINKNVKYPVLLLTDKGGYKVFNPNNLPSNKRTSKTTELYKFYRTEPHKVACATLYNPSLHYTYNSSIYGVKDLEIDSKPTPLGKNIKSQLLKDNAELILGISSNNLVTISNDIKTYVVVDEEVTKTTGTPKVEEKDITIFDLLDELK